MPHDFDDYAEDGFAPIPARTMLFCLDPIGIGTAQCESLTSYLVRLAREHSLPVRRFVSRLLFSQAIEARPQCDAKFFSQYAATINGVGPYAQRFAQVLNHGTGRTDLEMLTLRPWRQLLPPNGSKLTSAWQRWCPECMAPGDESTFATPGLAGSYLPLAWSIASVHACNRHGVPLVERCPHCARRQPAIPRVADFVHCDSCRRALALPAGSKTEPSAPDVSPPSPLAVAEELISLNAAIDPDAVHRRWTDAVSRRIADMGCDRATLCRGVGLNPRAMNAWMTRGTGVSIDALIKVLGGLQMSVLDVFGSIDPAARQSSAAGERPHCKTAVRREHHSLEVRALAASLLDQAAAADQPKMLREIAATLGTSTGFIRYWHPQKVANLRSRHLEIQRTERLARLERHRRDVEAAVEQLKANGLFPGRKAVEAAVRARGASLIQPQNYAAYRLALNACGRTEE